MKTIIKDIFFDLRMGFGIKLFSLKKSLGYYSRMKDALVGLKKNVYCRLGKKVIICSHHLQFIDYYKGLKTLEEVTDYLNQNFGVEDEGIIWCNNCGEEISISEYESMGDFTKSGARDVTHEEVDLSEEY